MVVGPPSTIVSMPQKIKEEHASIRIKKEKNKKLFKCLSRDVA